MNKVYGVRLLKEKVSMSVLGSDQSIKLSWANGMVGAMPVFASYEEAYNYAEDENLIFELKANNETI